MSCKPKSRGLRMADGGELMKRFASRQPTLRAADGGMFVPGENQGGANAQMYGRMSADLAQPAAAAPAADPGRRDRMLSAAHSVPQFQPMAIPGLRDGGDLRTGQGGNVPGSGTGDKIPAKYEPGEFVVSNDMLDAAPQLRSQLRDLRGNVLAAKGMTPEQADAKALGYDGSPSGGQDGQQEAGLPGRPGNRRGGERASLRDAGSEAGVQRRDGGWGPSAGLGANGAQGGDTGIGRSLRPVHQVGLRALDGFETTERPWNGSQDARAFAQQPGPGNPNVGPNGSSQAQAFQQARAPSPAPAPAAVAPTPTTATPKPTLRAGIAGETGALSKSLYAGGRAVAPIAKLAGALAPVAIGGEIVNHFNDYKINDPGVDSSFVGNVRDVSNGDYGKAWSGFKKGALEAGMDLGSSAANTLDYVVPGKAPVSTAYNRSLRNAFGDQLVPHDSVTAQADAASDPAQSSASAPYNPNQTAETAKRTGLRLSGRQDMGAMADPRRLTLDGADKMNNGTAAPADPSRGSLGASRDFTNELNSRPGGRMAALPSDLREGVVHKTVDAQGRVTYSGRNVGVNSNGETQMVDGTGRTLRMLNGNNDNFAYSVDSSGKRNGAIASQGSVGLRGGADINPALAAAGARGDMDAVKGYYANKGEAFAGVTPEQYRAQQTQDEAAPKRGEFGYNHYMANKVQQDQTKATLRGQDMQYKIAMAPIEMQARMRQIASQISQKTGGDHTASARLAMEYGSPEMAKQFQELHSAALANTGSEQTQGTAARNNMAKEFNVFTPDNKLDEAGSQAAYSAIRKIAPGMDNMTEDARSKTLPELKILSKVFGRAYQGNQMGWDKVNPMEPRGPEMDSMPNWQGGKLVRDNLTGLVTPGSGVNNYYVEHGGRKIPLGKDLSTRELEVIRHHLTTGQWRGAPTNTQKGN